MLERKIPAIKYLGLFLSYGLVAWVIIFCSIQLAQISAWFLFFWLALFLLGFFVARLAESIKNFGELEHRRIYIVEREDALGKVNVLICFCTLFKIKIYASEYFCKKNSNIKAGEIITVSRLNPKTYQAIDFIHLYYYKVGVTELLTYPYPSARKFAKLVLNKKI